MRTYSSCHFDPEEDVTAKLRTLNCEPKQVCMSIGPLDLFVTRDQARRILSDLAEQSESL